MGLWDLQWWQMVLYDLNYRIFVLRDLSNVTVFHRNHWESQFSAQLKCHHLFHCSPCMCQVVGSWPVWSSLYTDYSHLISVDMPFFHKKSYSYKRWWHLPQKETDYASLPAVPLGSRRFMLLWPSEYSLHPSSYTLLVWLTDQPGHEKERKKRKHGK